MSHANLVIGIVNFSHITTFSTRTDKCVCVCVCESSSICEQNMSNELSNTIYLLELDFPMLKLLACTNVKWQ